MAAPLVHAPTDKKGWFIASTYTYYKVALAYIYAIFSKHSAELLLCISCDDDSLYILSLKLSPALSLAPVRSISISYLSICFIHFANTSSAAARPMHAWYKMFCPGIGCSFDTH